MYMSALSIALAIPHPSLPIYPGLALGLAISSTLFFVNLIPFMKFDGYYAICDYFAFPNLRDRAFKLARAWLARAAGDRAADRGAAAAHPRPA